MTSDRAYLAAHGIEARPEDLDAALVRAVDALPARLAASSAEELTAAEVAVLEEGGFHPDPRPARGRDDPLTRAVVDHAALIKTAVDVVEAARLMGRNASRIRQRLGESSLYGVRDDDGWLLPAFQFIDGGTLPGLGAVLRALPKSLHPLEVEAFFLTSDADLEPPEGWRALSPRDWLRAGLPVDDVVRLAADL